jgi:hypothetical protein
MVDFAPQVAAQAGAAARPSVRRYYALGLLTVAYALNFLDRTIFNVLIEPIKKEFTLSDTTMGLLAGFGFVLFYSLLGIPIARSDLVSSPFIWGRSLRSRRPLPATATCFGQGVGPLQ